MVSMENYQRKGAGRRKPALVKAVRVERPYRKIQFDFPRSHRRDRPSGALDYIRLIDAEPGRNRAREGDWIVQHANGSVEVVPAEEFASEYIPASEIGTQDTEASDLD